MENQKEKEKQMAGIESTKYPFEPSKKNIPPFVKEQRFKMNVKKEEVDEVRTKLNNFKMIMSSTKGMEILQKPVIKSIKTIDTLYFHPSYQTTIILPEGSEISYVKPSFKITDTISYSNNIINVQPDKDFLNGNIVVYYSKNRKNYHLNIIAKNYTTAKCKLDKEGEQFLCYDSAFGIVYEYTDKKDETDTDIFFSYVDLVEKDMKDINKTGFASLIYMGKMYYIIEDNKFGTIFYHGNKYRIASRL